MDTDKPGDTETSPPQKRRSRFSGGNLEAPGTFDGLMNPPVEADATSCRLHPPLVTEALTLAAVELSPAPSINMH